MNNDEIELACDALWFVKRRGIADADQERLWSRLQPVRTGDNGGTASAELTREDVAAIVRALRACLDEVELDDDEQRLLDRLTAN